MCPERTKGKNKKWARGKGNGGLFCHTVPFCGSFSLQPHDNVLHLGAVFGDVNLYSAGELAYEKTYFLCYFYILLHITSTHSKVTKGG